MTWDNVECPTQPARKHEVTTMTSRRHGAKSFTTALSQEEQLPSTAKGYEATAVDAIARRGGKISVHNLQANIGRVDGCQSHSVHLLSYVLNFSDDDDEICAWIWMSSRMARLGHVNNTE